MKNILGIDIDGVLNYLHLYLIREIKKAFNINANIKNYDLFKSCGITEKEKNKFYENTRYSLFNKLQPEWRCAEYLYEINKQYNIYIITARPYEIEQDTLDWLYKWNIPFDDITFDAGSKLDACKKLQVTYMIEDSPWNVKLLNTNKINTFIFDRPYNAFIKDTKYITRVYNWKDIYELLI